ncbi:MAG: tyrosine-type recombinase/integrase [Porticoccaceae bacterium]
MLVYMLVVAGRACSGSLNFDFAQNRVGKDVGIGHKSLTAKVVRFPSSVPKMPKKAPQLSDLEVRRLRHGFIKGDPRVKGENRKHNIGDPCTAFHAVGGVAGLLLVCRPPGVDQKQGSRSWILRTMVGDKRRDIGLGGYPDVSLGMAREKAQEAKELIRQGVDPVANRRAIKSAVIREQAKTVTFREMAAEYIAKKAKELKTEKQVQKLANHLKNYAYPHIGNMVISDIELRHIEKLLKPIWETKTETANRVRQAIENTLDLAGVRGLRHGDNPARWKGNLEHALPARNKVARVQHYSALPVSDMPTFMAELVGQTSQAALALQFAILTAARPGEVRGATWDEIDLKNRLWTVPAERMKKGRPHRVPLCSMAVQLLEALPAEHQLIFTNQKGLALSDAIISRTPKNLGYNVTAHGFRATFRTWAQEHTNYAEEVVELALAHVNSDATRAAYARSELIDKRRLLMSDWEVFCWNGNEQGAGAKVLALKVAKS